MTPLINPNPASQIGQGQNELNEKVARLCGWFKFEHYSTGLYGWTKAKQDREAAWLSKDGSGLYPVPDYCNDLNACAEFEKTLDNEQKTDYIRLLNAGDFSCRRLAFATAEQRCKAFVATMEARSVGGRHREVPCGSWFS